jgi:hypothetical protein
MAKNTMVKDLEPSYEGLVPATQLQVVEALNWYGVNKNEADAAKYLGCDVKFAKNFMSLAWTTRMAQRGFIFSDGTKAVIDAMRAKFEDDVNPKTPVVVVNLQERISSKTDEYIGELEGMLDEHGVGLKAFNAYDWFIRNDVKPMHASKIIEYFEYRSAQFVKEVESKDTREGYAVLGKDKIKSILAVMASIITDAKRLSQNVNKSRKPRKKKAVNFQKLAAKVLYKEKDVDLKIQSIDPVNIIGASQLWAFNVKTKRLAVYNAQDEAGLFLKGTRVIGYSTGTSFAKTLRKPEKVLNNVLNGGKLVLRKLMDEVNGKSFPLNGKINRDTILLRALK